jgi:hypothetical protein
MAAAFGICVVAVVMIADREFRPGSTAALIRDFPRLQGSVQAAIGIALQPVGGSETPLSLGDWTSGPAWSTIKVPLVIAALRDESPPGITDQMTAAITRSDNAAADAIWAGLGDAETAAGKVEAVLAETGDSTRVEFHKVRSEFSVYGQTDWALTEQVRFLSAAACDLRDTPVFSLMGQIEKDQRWGLGAIAGARFKGGWGPSRVNKYLVRQMGVIVTPAGATAVAVAAEPHSGKFADGVRALSQITEWLSDHIIMLPSARCPHSRHAASRQNEYLGRDPGDTDRMHRELR